MPNQGNSFLEEQIKKVKQCNEELHSKISSYGDMLVWIAYVFCDCICCVFDFKNNEVQTNKALFHGLRRYLSLCYYHKGFLTAVYIYTLLNLNRPLHIIYEDVT